MSRLETPMGRTTPPMSGLEMLASRMALLTPPPMSRPVMSTSSLAFPMSGTTLLMMLASRRGMTTAPMARRVYPVRFQLRN